MNLPAGGRHARYVTTRATAAFLSQTTATACGFGYSASKGAEPCLRRDKVKVVLIGAACLSAGVVLALQSGYAMMSSPAKAASDTTRLASCRHAGAIPKDCRPVAAVHVLQQDVPGLCWRGWVRCGLSIRRRCTRRCGAHSPTVDFIEGREIKKGERLAQIDPRVFQAQVDQAEATLGRDRALLAYAEADLGNSLPLLSRGFATPQQVERKRRRLRFCRPPPSWMKRRPRARARVELLDHRRALRRHHRHPENRSRQYRPSDGCGWPRDGDAN